MKMSHSVTLKVRYKLLEETGFMGARWGRVLPCAFIFYFILFFIPNNTHLKAPALTSLNVKRNLLS